MRFILVVCLVSTLLIAAPAAGEDAKSEDELVRTVILQNDAARRRIDAYTIEQEWKSIEPYVEGASGSPIQEDLTNTGWMRAVVKGDYLLVNRKEKRTTPSGKGDHEVHYQAVLNDDYFAYYMGEPVNSITLTEHGSILKMREGQSDPSKSALDPPALRYSFGDGSSTLRSLYEKSLAYSSWEAKQEELEGESVYRITWTRKRKDGSARRSYFIVDPNRDFLLRRIEHLNNEGQPRIIYEIDLQLLQDSGMWFPKTVHLKEYDDNKLEMWLKVTKASIAPPIDMSVFSISSFQLPLETRMRRLTRGGQREIKYSFRNGKWEVN